MIKKTITYTNFADEEVTEDFEFHLSKAEVGKMELSGEGNSMVEYLKRISKAENGREIIRTMEEIVEKAYGVRTLDGKGFEKKPEHLAAFKASGAYDALFEELLMSSNSAELSANFIRGLFPASMQENIPSDNATLTAVAQKEGFIPAHVKMPTDRQVKVVPDPEVVYSVPEPHAEDTETVEQLRARIAAMEAVD